MYDCAELIVRVTRLRELPRVDRVWVPKQTWYSRGVQTRVIRVIEPEPQPILGVALPEPVGELSTVIQEARFKKMMGKKDADEGMGMAIAAAAVFLVLAYAMS